MIRIWSPVQTADETQNYLPFRAVFYVFYTGGHHITSIQQLVPLGKIKTILFYALNTLQHITHMTLIYLALNYSHICGQVTYF